MGEIDEAKRMIVADRGSRTQQTWVTFYNAGAAEAFERFKPDRDPDDGRVFQTVKQPASRKFRQISEATGVTVQKLRRWFATGMSRLGVDAKYIDALSRRTKSSVLEKHYLDDSAERLKKTHDEAGLTVLE
ncbi:hypothetical protein JCM18237_22550 [Halorubrum luteum]